MSESRSSFLRDRLLASMFLVVIASSNILNIGQLCAFGGANPTEVLPMHTFEKVEVFSNGDAKLAVQTNIPESPLADTYRKTLAVPSDANLGQEIPIPENTTQGSVTVPVREEYYRSIEKEQKLSLGFTTRVVDSSIVPRNRPNGLKISVKAFATLQVVNVTGVGSDGLWEVVVGSRDENSGGYAMGQAVSKITFAQMLLKSLDGQQVYESSWTMRIGLPGTASLLNREELDGLSWTLSFGGGTFMSAFVYVDGSSTVVLDERFVVTEENITKSPSAIFEAFLGYKVFRVKYLLPNSASTGRARLESGDFERDWSMSWSLSWKDTATISLGFGDASVSLKVTPSLSLSGYVGWDFEWVKHERNGITYWLYEPVWFEAWIGAAASINIGLEVATTVTASEQWETQLFSLDLIRFDLWVGPVPVYVDLTLSGIARLEVSVSDSITFTVEVSAEASFRTGVSWTKQDGWSPISDADAHAELIGPSIAVHRVQASITPSLEFRLSLLFYGQSGPYVGFEPYVNGSIIYYPDDDFAIWKISAGFNINSGVSFSGWLADLLGLKNKEYTIYARELASWDGHWGRFPSSISIEVWPKRTYKGGGTMIVGAISSIYGGRPWGTVYIEYSSDGGVSWNSLVSVEPTAFGRYAYWWKPPEDGTFNLRSSWDGNSEYSGRVSQTTTLRVDKQATGEVEFGEDDGSAETYLGNPASADGYAVLFNLPEGMPLWVITEIKVYGMRKLKSLNYGLRLVLVNNSQAMEVLFAQDYNGSDYFSVFGSWASFPIPEIMFSQDPTNPGSFYVCAVPLEIDTGLRIGADQDTIYHKSYYVTKGIGDSKFTADTKHNFMIHTLGHTFLAAAFTCKNVTELGPGIWVGNATDVFHLYDDAEIYAFVRFNIGTFNEGDEVTFKWYDPAEERLLYTGDSKLSKLGFAYSRLWWTDFLGTIGSYLRRNENQILGCPFKIKIYYLKMFVGQLTFRFTLHESTVTVSSLSDSITLGQSLDFSATLSPSLSKGTMSMEYSTNQTDWTVIASGPPTNGSYSSPWIPTSAGQYYVRVNWDGTEGFFGNTSVPLPILVKKVTTALSISVSPTTIVQGVNATASVTLTPKLQGKTVVFQSSIDNAAWFCIGSGTTDSNGQNNLTWTPIKLGTKHYIRATWYGDSDFKEANSTSATLMIKIPPNTTLTVEEPKLINNSLCITSQTLLTLAAEDTSGNDINGTFYRVYNATTDAGETAYTQPFCLTGLSDGEYIVDYYSRDNVGTTELANKVVVLLDNLPPLIDTPLREPAGDVQPNQPVKIQVAATDNTTQIENVTLSYTTSGGASWNQQLMTCNSSTNLYEATIPPQPAGTLVEYKIIAYDTTGNSATKDKTSAYCVYEVIPEYQSTIYLLLFVLLSILALAIAKKKASTRPRGRCNQFITNPH